MKRVHSPERVHSPVRKEAPSRDSRGAVIVEFALMLPLLVLILILIVDLGWVLRELQIIQNAAREGARFSMLQPNTPTVAEVQQVVINYCSQEGIAVAASDITVNQSFLIPGPGFTDYGSEVTVSYPRRFLVPGTGLLPSGQMTLVGRAVFRNLY